MGLPRADALIEDLSPLRRRVLARSPSPAPDLDAAAGWLAGLPDSVFASRSLKGRGRRTLIQPRGGFARYEEQKQLMLALKAGGADFIPLTIDSHTRQNDYETAAILLQRSEVEDRNLLNGYPLVNHGYLVSRGLSEGLERPISLRHGTPDARLLVEIALAAGITEIEGGALTYTLPYTKAHSLAEAVLNWQYVDRLCAMHSTPERPIHRESFGVLTATLVPPVLVAVVELCELLLAAEQGVTSFAVSFAQTGSLAQDLALGRVLREASADYLSRLGLGPVCLHLVYHQWMGAFPRDATRALALIAGAAQIAGMIGADKIVTKTKDEAIGIPTAHNNAEAVQLVRYILDRSSVGAPLTSAHADEEAHRIRRGLDAIMTAIFDLPPRTFWRSVAMAFDRGLIDIPFSPHQANANQLVSRRGRDDGIYIEQPGRVPLPGDVLAGEAAGLAARHDTGNTASTFSTLMRDINLMVA